MPRKSWVVTLMPAAETSSAGDVSAAAKKSMPVPAQISPARKDTVAWPDDDQADLMPGARPRWCETSHRRPGKGKDRPRWLARR